MVWSSRRFERGRESEKRWKGYTRKKKREGERGRKERKRKERGERERKYEMVEAGEKKGFFKADVGQAMEEGCLRRIEGEILVF